MEDDCTASGNMFVMSFSTSLGQVAYLRSILLEYIDMRQKLFVNGNLKPKHHYITHYAEPILKLEPLRQLWTLRFESKHRYFKNIVKHIPNYKNVLFTFAERHQLLQALVTLQNSLFDNKVSSNHVTIFKHNDYPDYVSSIIESNSTFEKPFVSFKLNFGELYTNKACLYVMVKRNLVSIVYAKLNMYW